jgi:hypothetical protein
VLEKLGLDITNPVLLEILPNIEIVNYLLEKGLKPGKDIVSKILERDQNDVIDNWDSVKKILEVKGLTKKEINSLSDWANESKNINIYYILHKLMPNPNVLPFSMLIDIVDSIQLFIYPVYKFDIVEFFKEVFEEKTKDSARPGLDLDQVNALFGFSSCVTEQSCKIKKIIIESGFIHHKPLLENLRQSINRMDTKSVRLMLTADTVKLTQKELDYLLVLPIKMIAIHGMNGDRKNTSRYREIYDILVEYGAKMPISREFSRYYSFIMLYDQKLLVQKFLAGEEL